MKKLKLRKETLRELEGGGLGQAAAGIQWTPVINTIPPTGCVQTRVAAVCLGVTLNGCTTAMTCP